MVVRHYATPHAPLRQCSARRPGLSDADWCLRSDVMPNSRLQGFFDVRRCGERTDAVCAECQEGDTVFLIDSSESMSAKSESHLPGHVLVCPCLRHGNTHSALQIHSRHSDQTIPQVRLCSLCTDNHERSPHRARKSKSRIVQMLTPCRRLPRYLSRLSVGRTQFFRLSATYPPPARKPVHAFPGLGFAHTHRSLPSPPPPPPRPRSRPRPVPRQAER